MKSCELYLHITLFWLSYYYESFILVTIHTHQFTPACIYNQFSNNAYKRYIIFKDSWIIMQNNEVLWTLFTYYYFFCWVTITRGLYLLSRRHVPAWSGQEQLFYFHRFSILSPSQDPNRFKNNNIYIYILELGDLAGNFLSAFFFFSHPNTHTDLKINKLNRKNEMFTRRFY